MADKDDAVAVGNDLDAARLALRWALEHIQRLQQQVSELNAAAAASLAKIAELRELSAKEAFVWKVDEIAARLEDEREKSLIQQLRLNEEKEMAHKVEETLRLLRARIESDQQAFADSSRKFFERDGVCDRVRLGELARAARPWMEGMCTEAMIVSERFRPSADPEEFFKLNIERLESPREYRLPLGDTWKTGSDPTMTAVICAYPSGTVRTVSAQTRVEGRDLVVGIPDGLIFLDPDHDPVCDDGEARCSVALFAVPIAAAPAPAAAQESAYA